LRLQYYLKCSLVWYHGNFLVVRYAPGEGAVPGDRAGRPTAGTVYHSGVKR
jgi:hypothetical protein